MHGERVCHVFGAGELFSPWPSVNPDDYIIAADGGYAHLQNVGLRADLVIGDFDSLTGQPNDTRVVMLPKEKDDTDMLAALHAGLAQGYRHFYIHGGTGGRMDHTLANIQCLAALAGKGARGFLFDRDCIMTAITNGNIIFPGNQHGYVSVFAYAGMACGVTLKGLKYALEDATLLDTYPLGVSNEFTPSPSSIVVQSGTLLVVYPKSAHAGLL